MTFWQYNTRKPSWCQLARQRRVYEDLFLPSHRCLTPPIAEKRLAISTQSICRWKVHLHVVGYNSVADNTADIRLAVIASLVWRPLSGEPLRISGWNLGYHAKTRGTGLSYGENFIILTSTLFVWSTRVTDGRTDRRTDARAIVYTRYNMLSRVNKSKNINVTEHVSMTVNEAHYLRHQSGQPTSTYNKATADQLWKVSHSPRHKRRRRWRSRLPNQRRTQQDHWRSTHDTEDNITTGRDVPRTDGSAVPPNNVLPRSRQRSGRIRKTSRLITSGTTARNNQQGLSFVLTYHVSNVSLTDWPQRPTSDCLSGLTDELNIADCVSVTEGEINSPIDRATSRSCHTRRKLWQTTTHNNVELEQFLACFRVARVCQRQLGFLVQSP